MASWTTGLDQLIDEVPGLGYKFTATATSGGATVTTTDPEINKLGSNAPSNRLQGLFLYIPSASGANQIHSVTTISVSAATTTITTLGSYTATSTDAATYLLGVHPDILRRLANDALALIPVECIIPLAHGPEDYDLQDSDTVDTSWTETNATDATQTTASEVFVGARSFVVTDSGSGGGYTASAAQRVGQGESVAFHAIVKADTGTSALTVVDGSSNEEFSVETTQEQWVYITKLEVFDSTDETFTVRLEGVSASAAGDWQFAWYVRQGESYFNLPSWVNERVTIKSVSKATFRVPGREADTWLAGSLKLESLQEGVDYEYGYRAADANPNSLFILRPHLLKEPLFLVLQTYFDAPYGVSGTFSTDSDTTTCPTKTLVAKCKQLLGQRYASDFPDLEAIGRAEYEQERGKTVTPRPRLPQWGGPTGGRRV